MIDYYTNFKFYHFYMYHIQPFLRSEMAFQVGQWLKAQFSWLHYFLSLRMDVFEEINQLSLLTSQSSFQSLNKSYKLLNMQRFINCQCITVVCDSITYVTIFFKGLVGCYRYKDNMDKFNSSKFVKISYNVGDNSKTRFLHCVQGCLKNNTQFRYAGLMKSKVIL